LVAVTFFDAGGYRMPLARRADLRRRHVGKVLDECRTPQRRELR
jgi:hypothetical protein